MVVLEATPVTSQNKMIINSRCCNMYSTGYKLYLYLERKNNRIIFMDIFFPEEVLDFPSYQKQPVTSELDFSNFKVEL